MIRSRLQRGAAFVGASTLALGLVGAGFAVGTAGATNPVPGVTSNSVTIGATVPLSGIAAGYATVSAAANAVFKYVNNKGGVNHRKITYIRLDDCYNLAAAGLGCTQDPSTTTLSQTQVLVNTDHVFATVGGLGTAAQESVSSFLNSTSPPTPQLFVNSGSSAWNNPGTYPGLFGFQASYQEESKIFAKFIKSHFSGKKVGFIGQNDDFGTDGLAGLINGTGLSVAGADQLTYNAFDAVLPTGDIAPDVQTLKNDLVKVVVLDSIPPVTKQILKAAAAISYKPTWVISSVGSNPLSVNYIGEANAYSLNSLPATNDKLNPWNVWLRKVLLADHTDFPHFTSTSTIDANTQYGASFAVAFLEALKNAGASPTQTSMLAAMKSTTYATPSFAPLKYTSTNHQGLNCGLISQIAPNGTKAPIYIAEPTSLSTVYCTQTLASTAVTTGAKHVTAIPLWMK